MQYNDPLYQAKAADLDNEAMELSEETAPEDISLKTYLMSIIFMPKAMRILCLTNIFCWGSLVCYFQNFTDFVGQAVFEGSPVAKGEYQAVKSGIQNLINKPKNCKPSSAIWRT